MVSIWSIDFMQEHILNNIRAGKNFKVKDNRYFHIKKKEKKK